MPEYLLTGRDPTGKTATERVEADSVDAAVQTLRDRGFTDIVPHTDDVGAFYSKQAQLAEVMSPREYLQFRNLPGPLAVFLFVVSKGYRQGWFLYLGALAILAYRRLDGASWGLFDSGVAIYLMLPVMFALGAQLFRGASRRYENLIEAIAWGRWDEALALSDQGKIPVAPEELAFRKASALAGLDRLDEALAVVERFAGGTTIPEWMYQARLTDVYQIARHDDEAAQAMDRALELAPDNATVLLDTARVALDHHRDPRRARDLLARARRHALADTLQPFATAIEGGIHLEEGRPNDGLPLLERAYRELSRFRFASPLTGLILDLMHAHLTLAHAAVGDPVTAERHFRQAEPRLQALRKDDLLQRCRHALALPDHT
jgi:tetratricopeptide (TPR) repeat protein